MKIDITMKYLKYCNITNYKNYTKNDLIGMDK